MNYSKRKDRLLHRSIGQVLEAVDRSGWHEGHITGRNGGGGVRLGTKVEIKF